MAGRAHQPAGRRGSHSAGGFFLGDYSARRPDIAARVFLSPLTSVRITLAMWWPDEEKRRRMATTAREMVASGRGHLLIPVPSWYYAISAASLVERLDERPGRWLDGCNASATPLLLAWGGAETRVPEWRSIYEEIIVPGKQCLEMPGVGHQYDGAHAMLADAITGFIEQAVSS